MKRIFAILLCLSLLTGSAAAFAAEPVNINLFSQTDETLSSMNGETKYVNSAVALGDSLFVLTDKTLEQWTVGQTEPTVLPVSILTYHITDSVSDESIQDAAADTSETEQAEAQTDNDVQENTVTEETAVADDGTDAATDAITQPEPTPDPNAIVLNKLFTDGASIYGLDTDTGDVRKLADASGLTAGTPIIFTLAWDQVRRTSDGDDYAYNPNIGDMAIVNGVLYALTTDWNSETPKYEIFGWDFANGTLKTHFDKKALRSLTPYKDGLFLCKLYDDSNTWDQESQTAINPTLVSYNPVTDEMTEVLTFETSSVFSARYSAKNDTLYYISGSTVFSLPGLEQPAKISAYLPNAIWDDGTCSLLNDTMVVSADYNGLAVRALDAPGIENGALSIYGDYGSRGHQAYVAANPQMPVVCSMDYYSTIEDFTNAMVSGNGAADVLRLDTNYSPLTRLIDKGYALDLSAYPQLTDLVSKMDPNLAKACMKDGNVYGIPVDMYGNTFAYSADAWSELGLTEADLPTSILGLMDFIDNWQADYADDYPNLRVIDGDPVKDSLLYNIMSLYVDSLLQANKPISFDTELFRKLIAKLDSMDFSELDENSGNRDDSYWSRNAVFTLYGTATSPGQYRYNMTLLPLPLDEGEPVVIDANVSVLIINPRTTRLDQAIQYVTTYTSNLEPAQAAITLFPDNNEPIINQSFEKDLASWKQTLAQLQQSLETAKPEEKADLENSIEYYTKTIADADTYRYEVSPDDISLYREKVAPYLTISGQTPLNTWSDKGENDFATQEQQFLQGAITSDQFIKEIDKRIRMIQLEDQ